MATMPARTWPDVAYKISAIFVRDARVALSYPWTIVLTLGEAAVSCVVAYFIALVAGRTTFNFGGAGFTYFDYLAVNMAFVRYQSAALVSFADVIRYGQATGTLELTLVTPTRLPTLVLGSALWSVLYATVQVVAYLVVATLFGLSLTHTNLATLLVVLALTVLSSLPLGVLLAALAVRYNKSGPIDFLVSTLTTIFGGIFIPLAALPLPMQWIGWCLPVTHALSALRGAVSGATLVAVRADLLWLAVASVLLLPISLRVFDFVIRRAKRMGTLGLY